MHWLESLDHAVFRFLNGSLANPVFDSVMPAFSHNALFYPILLIIALALIFKGGTRGRLCVVMLLVVVAIGDGLICKTLKDTFARLRPFDALEGSRLLIGKGGSGSMPSSHAANWFSGLAVAFIFYRKSWRFILPLAVLVGFSRVYNGVHFPSDVLAGAFLGIIYGTAIVFSLDQAWKFVGQRWFPLWWQKLPSLRCSRSTVATTQSRITEGVSVEQHWIRLGYLVILGLLLFRIGYLASAKIQLSEDEAYQWLWSKHLALSYFSKPPMIAWLQALGTSIFGDTELGVRFCSPVISAAMSLLLLRFVSKITDARTGFLMVLILSTAPLLSVGSILITVDPPLVFFWTAAMLAGLRAMNLDSSSTQTNRANNSTGWWIFAGLLLGLSFLSKYAALYQIVSWALFFLLWKPSRIHLRKPGPYLALLAFALCTIPVFVWNAQNNWITVQHVSSNAGITQPWKPTIRYINDFIIQQSALLNPFYVVGFIGAMFAFRKKFRSDPHYLFFFVMGAPVFLGYAAFTGYKRVFPNWIAPSIVPLFLLMVVYWRQRWMEGSRWVKPVAITGISVGAVLIVFLHDTNLIGKVAGKSLPAKDEPLRRVRAWDTTATVVGEEWKKLAAEGTPAFIIGAHYGTTAQISFYLPEAKRAAQLRQPLAYCITADHPENQFAFWPEYRYRDHRKGENALFVVDLNIKNPVPGAPPARLKQEFASIENWGVREIKYRDGRVFRYIQVFACRNLQ